MPYLERPNAEIYYEVWGDKGPWVTLLNGYTRSLRDFRLLGKGVVGLPRRVLVLDHRGSGKTRYRGKFTFEEMGEDVVALWEHLEVEGALLGISMGGALAQWLAGRVPERVNQLILVSTAPNFGHIRGESVPWSTDLDKIREKLSAYFAPDFPQRNRLLVEAMVKEIARSAQTGDFLDRAADQKRAMSEGTPDAYQAKVRAPVCVIHGTEDAVVPPEAAHALQAAFPAARMRWMEGMGHLLLAEAPRQLEAIVKEELTPAAGLSGKALQ